MAIDTFPSGSPPKTINVEVESPSAAGKHPVIVVVYGTRGLNPPFGSDIRTFADALKNAGFVALIPDYFARTGTAASNDPVGDLAITESFLTNNSAWVETLGDCLTYAAGRSDVDSARVGLLGFSAGGNLALRLAMRGGGSVRAVVEFFAPIDQLGFGSLGSGVGSLPPVQIHHGLDDGPPKGPVSPSQSQKLVNLLKASGKQEGTDYEHHTYPGQGHGFTGQAVTDSTKAAVAFFTKHLGVVPTPPAGG